MFQIILTEFPENRFYLKTDPIKLEKLLLLDRMNDIFEMTLEKNSEDELDEDMVRELFFEIGFINSWKNEVLRIHEFQSC